LNVELTWTKDAAGGVIEGLEPERVPGFRYLWLKRPRRFDPNECCAKALPGPWVTLSPEEGAELFARPPVPSALAILAEPGELLYLCGVADSYRHEENLHLPVRVTGDPNDAAEATTYNGYTATFYGAVAVPIRPVPPEVAARLRPTARQLACRNYQFGAQTFL
jgi:hypothetical protein